MYDVRVTSHQGASGSCSKASDDVHALSHWALDARTRTRLPGDPSREDGSVGLGDDCRVMLDLLGVRECFVKNNPAGKR